MECKSLLHFACRAWWLSEVDFFSVGFLGSLLGFPMHKDLNLTSFVDRLNLRVIILI